MRCLILSLVIALAGVWPCFGQAAGHPANEAVVIQAVPAYPTKHDAGAVDYPAQQASTDLDRIICREGEIPTGSRIRGKRECHTLRDWNTIEQDSRNALTRDQMKSYTNGAPGG